MKEQIMDWINARIGCSREHAWITLREKIRGDVARWQELQSDEANTVQVTSDDSYIVVSKEEGPIPLRRWCRAERGSSGIVITDETNNPTTFAPFLNAKGECRLLKGGEEMDFWQVSMFALEHVLF